MKKMLAIVSLLMLVGAGCFANTSTSVTTNTSTTPPPSPSAQTGGSVNGSAQVGGSGGSSDNASTQVMGSWKLLSLKMPGVEKPKDASALALTLTFNGDGKFSGKICNSMGGSFKIVEGNHLISTDLVSTKMFCEGVTGEIEAAFTADIAIGMGVARSEDTLVLLGATGNTYTLARQK